MINNRKLHDTCLTVKPPSNNDKYVCNNHVNFIYIYARHTKRNKKYTENGTKLFNWDQKKYIQDFLAQSIEQFRKSCLSYKLFMLEGKRLIIEIAIANFGPSVCVCVCVTSSLKNGRTDWADTYIVIFVLVPGWFWSKKSGSGSRFAGKTKNYLVLFVFCGFLPNNFKDFLES